MPAAVTNAKGGAEWDGAGVSADGATLALGALAWTLGEPARAERLLALTGLTAAALRARAAEPAVLAATLGFLEAREADLVACADALGVRPEALVAARVALDGGPRA